MTKTNRIVVASVLAVLLVLLIITNGRQNKKPGQIQNNPIKIGVLLPFSGNSASQGEKIKNGLELAADKINISGKKIELIYQDTEADTTKAVNSYQQLKSTQNISAVITWGSSIAMAILPQANQDHIIQMGVATATPKYRVYDDFNFRNYPSAEGEADFLAEKLKNKYNFSKAAIIYMNNDYGNGFAKTFSSDWAKLTGQTPPAEQFELGDSDFRTQLTKLKQTNPDVILVAAYAKEGGLILKQARAMNIKSQFASPSGIFGAELTTAAGNAAEGLLISDSIPELSDNSPVELKQFAADFKTKFGHTPGPEEMYAIRSYDALNALAAAFASCTSDDGACAKNALQKIHLDGAEGPLSFDEYGDTKMNFHLTQIKNGKFIVLNK